MTSEDSLAYEQAFSAYIESVLTGKKSLPSAFIVDERLLSAISDVNRKLACDQILRDRLFTCLTRLDLGESGGCISVIKLAISLINDGHCSPGLVFTLMEDMLECITVADCENLFSFLEANIETWRRPFMLNAGKNYLLRMCNNLLRRLSPLRNTIFCGRIQLFLAQMLPMDEKSALNLMGAFNVENITIYGTEENKKSTNENEAEKEPTDGSEPMEEDQASGESSKAEAAVDRELYNMFWGIQDYFRNPVQCYDPNRWTKFAENVSGVLKVFENLKSDASLDNCNNNNSINSTDDSEVYFAKHLTSENLFDLQINDVHFRRHFLIQLVIQFQYLQERDIKFKVNSHVCNEEMNKWIDSTRSTVFNLMESSPPNGSLLVKTVKHILGREKLWNSWKNVGCPSFVKTPAAVAPQKEASMDESMEPSPAKKRLLTGNMLAINSLVGNNVNRFHLGSPELTRLWNIEPDNLRACRAENRRTFPELQDFFAEASEQLDPAAAVEDEYKLILNTNFQWCALRLLARRSPHFFQPNANLRTVPDFLKAMIEKTYPAKPTESGASVTNGKPPGGKSLNNGSGLSSMLANEDNSMGGGETSKNGDGGDNSFIDEDVHPSESDINKISEIITTESLKFLAVQLDFKDDEIDELQKESNWCVTLLKEWIKREKSDATVANLVSSLLDIELYHIVHLVYPKLLPNSMKSKALEMLSKSADKNSGDAKILSEAAKTNKDPNTVPVIVQSS